MMVSPNVIAIMLCMLVQGNGLRVAISSKWDPLPEIIEYEEGQSKEPDYTPESKGPDYTSEMKPQPEISAPFDPFHQTITNHDHLPKGVDKETKKEKKKLKKTNVAFCIAGQARTFADPAVKKSMMKFVKLQRQSHTMDVFAYMTLEGDGPKNQSGNNYPAVNADKQAVEDVLFALDAKTYTLKKGTDDEVTEENVDQFITERACHQKDAGFWSDTDHLVRGINEIEHIRGCLRNMHHREEYQGFKYDVVVLTRPDLVFETDCYVDYDLIMKDSVQYDRVTDNACSIDWFVAAERWRMERLFKHPLPCVEKSSTFTGDTHTPEAMFDTLLNISHAKGVISANCHVAIQRPIGGATSCYGWNIKGKH
eukprot:gnl/MRDRNA2_/MRDRNA2_84381_c0_seq2.p1 gnl/MRDRNA2_/MRDRNA2_84381_c0~~gnl/MRDRNA2_/MRDRNA2_84381_c0_seq2.p1  ORF type:complete len:366 (+),score=56.11 gnl/MRDRNA2_/MRDRNA2_84381_c0_seq2:118-1215(+)